MVMNNKRFNCIGIVGYLWYLVVFVIYEMFYYWLNVKGYDVMVE